MKMIRLTNEANDSLDKLAGESDKSKQDLVAQASEILAVDYFFQKANKAYADLQDNPQAWYEEQEERAEFDGTLLDGIKED